MAMAMAMTMANPLHLHLHLHLDLDLHMPITQPLHNPLVPQHLRMCLHKFSDLLEILVVGRGAGHQEAFVVVEQDWVAEEGVGEEFQGLGLAD